MDDKKYFAALPEEEIGKYLVEKVDEYYKYLHSTQTIDLWNLCHEQFYSGYYTKGQILNVGKLGHKKYLMFNHFRNLLEHIKVLTTNQRPAFQPKAANPDFKSESQSILASGLLDYYMYRGGMEQVIDNAMDYALQSGEGWIMQEWDKNKGKLLGQKEIDKDTEEEGDENEEEDVEITENVYEGDIVTTSYHPVDVIRDIHKNTTEGNLWYIVRKFVDRYDTASKYPKFEDEILNSKRARDLKFDVILGSDTEGMTKMEDSDQIPYYVFRHDKSAALPNGRQVEFLEDGTIIFDGDLPYSNISLYVLRPNKRCNSNFGYTVAFDLLAPQKAVECLDSTILTNQSTFGVQNVIAPKGAGTESSTLAGGLNLIEYLGETPPASLNLTKTPVEIFNYKTVLIQQMETISGINSVSRGNPEASLKSGAALALVESMAIRFNSGFDNSYTQLLENLGTGTISMLRDYANTRRVAVISGISNRQYLREFTKEDLNQIDRVVVERGNALTKTIAGRTAIADSLMERGMLSDAEGYIQLLQTGRLEPLIEGATKEILNIRNENEELSNGNVVTVIITDNHALHIKEHGNVLKSPDLRKTGNETVIQNTLQHIQRHIDELRKGDPDLLMLLGQQPLQPAAPPVPPQNIPNTPEQGQSSPAAVGAPRPGSENINLPKMPSMPNNPLTNQPYDPMTGGIK